jgi:hypothetical protein
MYVLDAPAASTFICHPEDGGSGYFEMLITTYKAAGSNP